MRFDRIGLLETFIRVAERGSLSAAARDLGVTQPSISRQFAALEQMMGTVLAHRTTHKLTLTSEGTALLAQARGLVAQWRELEESNRAGSDLRGDIRAFAPTALGQGVLIKAATQFLIDHSGVSIDWRLTDRPIRFAEEGCDCWFRVGHVPDQSLVVREIGSIERLVVGHPETPNRSLEDLPWVSLGPYEGERIALFDENGTERAFSVGPRLTVDNIFASLEAVRQGLGIAILPHWLVKDLLKSGELVAPAPEWRAASLPLRVALPPGTRRPDRLSRFVESMTDATIADFGIAT